MMEFSRYFVAGNWVKSSGATVSKVINPATEECIAAVRSCSQADIDDAFESARGAFVSWRVSTLDQRRAVLRKLSDALAARLDAFVMAYVREVGAPVFLAREKLVPMASTNLGFIIDGIDQIEWTERIRNSTVEKTPAGVVAAITPWNHPLHQIVAKFAGAVAAGCAMVLKPSELTPAVAQLFAEAVAESGLPAGVFNLVWGEAEAGQYLTSHRDADFISFTGSRETGVKVIQASAPDIKRVALELGGKSAAIVLDDADIETAVRAVLLHCTAHSGQTCTSQARLLIPHRFAAAVEEQLVALADGVKIGDPQDEETRLGPVSSLRQFERVNGYIDLAVREGARRLTGGAGRAPGFARGFFVAPTVFADVTPSMTLAQEEVFGPVLALMTYQDDDEALRIANGTRYGLSGAIWSKDVARAKAFADGMRTGQVIINGAPQNLASPFGGFGASGMGRENGRFSIEAFLELKSVQAPG
ncbi:MAG: putative aldehyde dehydrogenase [Noviherbaspirillum sp.]|nr:putative aldehyde dehydrogenase [Noviherbaspirillum sp.]